MTPEQSDQLQAGLSRIETVARKVAVSNNALTDAALSGLDQESDLWKTLADNHERNLADLARIDDEMLAWVHSFGSGPIDT